MLLFVSSNVAAMTSRANQQCEHLLLKTPSKEVQQSINTINEYSSIFPYTSPFKYAISTKSHNISQNVASPTLPIILVETRHPAFLPSITCESLWTTLIVLIVKGLNPTSSTSSTLFHKTIGYNRLARKIAIANLGGPVKRKINWKEKEGKTTIWSYNK